MIFGSKLPLAPASTSSALEVRFQKSQIDVVRTGEPAYGPCHQHRLADGHPECNLLEGLPGIGVEQSDGPEIEQPESPDPIHEHVPGVRVGMVGAILEHLGDERVQEALGQLFPGYPGGLQGKRVIDRPAHDLLHHQEAAGRDGLVDPRNADRPFAIGCRIEPLAHDCLALVVELAGHAEDQLLGELTDPKAAGAGHPPLRHVRDHPQDRGIPSEEIGHAWALDLDHDPLPVEEDGAVRLADRGGGQRLPFEGGEDFLDRPLELGFDQGPDLFGRNRPHGRTQFGQRVDDRRSQEITPGRRNLSELHEHAPGVLEHVLQPITELRRGNALDRREPRAGETPSADIAGDLPEAPDGRQGLLDPGEGMQQQAPPAPPPRTPLSGYGNDLEDDGQDHGGQQTEQDGQRVPHLVVRLGTALERGVGPGQPHDPPEDGGDDPPQLPRTNPEDPAAGRSHDKDEGDRHDEAQPTVDPDRDRGKHVVELHSSPNHVPRPDRVWGQRPWMGGVYGCAGRRLAPAR